MLMCGECTRGTGPGYSEGTGRWKGEAAGLAGGLAGAKKLSKKRRSEIAKKGGASPVVRAGLE